ncbi:hypothetical protein FHETE_376 [Fusarium heterosporum]|uniref:Uncharacterized protein n=1 Tax=Fusarium heterosporum TaxID=42747 RepID=A0A8H5U6F4_FUSHE|nr:hypothetical protein FHETE_376 [Fusarium heterosporum]
MNPQYLLQPGENPVTMVPPDGWPGYLNNTPQDIKYYNIFVGQWESWAKADPREDWRNWADAAHWACGMKLPNISNAIGRRRNKRCYAYVVLACMKWSPEELKIVSTGRRLQKWYPKADITMMHYNNNRPVVMSALHNIEPEASWIVVRDDVLPVQNLNLVPQQHIERGYHVSQQGVIQREESATVDLTTSPDFEGEHQNSDTQQEESTDDLSLTPGFEGEHQNGDTKQEEFTVDLPIPYKFGGEYQYGDIQEEFTYDPTLYLDFEGNNSWFPPAPNSPMPSEGEDAVG